MGNFIFISQISLFLHEKNFVRLINGKVISQKLLLLPQ
jgi:hypothetical protein